MIALSKEEEEKSLALHKKSVYVDTHCDTIMAWMPPPELTWVWLPKLPDEMLKSLKDIKRRSLSERSEAGHLDLPRMVEGGVDCQVFAVYVSPLYHTAPLKRALQMIDAFYSELNKNSDKIALCTGFADILRTHSEGKISALLSIEGGEPLDGDLGVLRMLYKLGVRLLTLTHSPRNRLGDGCGEEGSKGGLTTFGAQVIEEMNKLGMIVDVSHLNERGFWDVIKITKSPIIASHSNARALCDHTRNLTDDQIKALAESDGVIGVTFVRRFLGKDVDTVTVNNVLDHIDHIVKLVGVDHVGIGSDYDGIDQAPKGLEDVTKVPNITRGLVYRGYSNDDIEKILGANFLRVFRKILG